MRVTNSMNFFRATCARYDLLQHTLAMFTVLTR